MANAYPNNFQHYNTNRWMANNSVPAQVVNVTAQVERPCPVVPPVFVSYVYGSPIGWNAVLVGLLSCLLALVFLLTCLYYLAFRRRFMKQVSDCPSPVVLVDKAAASTIPVTSTSQTATTTFMHEPGKETKINTYSEQASGPMAAGDFVVGMPTLGNGHAAPSLTNGLLANGNTDPSELRLLQHEHH
ncbi:unnamed protein product [Adineta steineri]|uniref:Uncharacterized protein n=1 Tax=Adineta steineri TaxID=433720 RepID=A0A813TIQ1_9BILA|nr:unnamed protein product [Adineta steineri]CAF3609664.1 unnamed protein product [Adineta steineri]